MAYEKINLFGGKTSKGSFDDFFNTEKYPDLQSAYKANDYVEADFVKDENGIIYIEARNIKNPEDKKYYRLNFQHCPAGLDGLDDNLAAEMAASLL